MLLLQESLFLLTTWYPALQQNSSRLQWLHQRLYGVQRVRLMPIPVFLHCQYQHFPKDTLRLCSHVQMHCVVPVLVFQNDTPPYFLPFPGAIQPLQGTSIILYPKKHGRYNPAHSNPLAMDCKKFLPLQKNINGTWQSVPLFGCYHLPQ